MNNELFPLAAKYDKDWVKQVSIIENVLYFVESLWKVMELRKGMRVLDLGCGKAGSSIFLAREFDVQVWAVDKEFSPTENYRRIVEAGCDNKVFPLRADARNLPFPKEFFDVIISIDAYGYFGTDERYLPYLVQFIKPKGLMGIVDACFTRELKSLSDVPEYLIPLYKTDNWDSVHSIQWWKNLWEKTGLVKILCAEILPQNDFLWHEYIKNAKDLESEKELVNALLGDKEKLIAYFRLIGQQTEKQSYLESFEQTQ